MSTSPLTEFFSQPPPGLIEEICDGDRMFKGDAGYYLKVGLSALENVRLAMLAAGIHDFADILDFPSGHGRVLRYLKAAFPNARLTTCDIETAAADFCERAFGATKVYGHEDPWKIKLPSQYDLIWVGSLLTHLDKNRCIEFLEYFRSILKPRGLLVFTMHGREIAQRMAGGTSAYGLAEKGVKAVLKNYRRKGFGYENYPKKKTFGVSENYGVSLVSPRWTFEQLEALRDMRLVAYTEKGWDSTQDVIACVRE